MPSRTTHAMPNRNQQTLARVEKELSRIGLLMQHDARLPSFTALVAGRPIAGSWWGHPLGHDIYDLLTIFESGSGKLSVKLINGKITYVHLRLWPAFLKLVQHGETARARGTPSLAHSLWQEVRKKGVARADELCAAGFATSRALATATRDLEQRLLVHSDAVHTASGAHTKVLRSWSVWSGGTRAPNYEHSLADARAELRSAVDRLQERLRERERRLAKVPLLDGDL